LNNKQLSIARIGNVHCFDRRRLYSQATQKYVIASSNLSKTIELNKLNVFFAYLSSFIRLQPARKAAITDRKSL